MSQMQTKQTKRWEDLDPQAKLALIKWYSGCREYADITIDGLSTHLLSAEIGQKTLRVKWGKFNLDLAALLDETVKSLDIKSKIKEIEATPGGLESFESIVRADIARSQSPQSQSPHASSAYRQPAQSAQPSHQSPPSKDGESKVWKDLRWISCCGVWWSKEAWSTMSSVSSGLLAHGDHSGTPSGTCRKCGKILVAAQTAENQEDALTQYQNRLQETEPGNWVPFNEPVIIPPGATGRLSAMSPVPHYATHLAIPEGLAKVVTVHCLRIGCINVVSGPLPGELFAVRIPKEYMRSIDRGGSIEPAMLLPGLPVDLQVVNKSGAPVSMEAALFGKRVDADRMYDPIPSSAAGAVSYATGYGTGYGIGSSVNGANRPYK